MQSSTFTSSDDDCVIIEWTFLRRDETGSWPARRAADSRGGQLTRRRTSGVRGPWATVRAGLCESAATSTVAWAT